MAPKFGTSGLRGLVSDLTPDLIADYTRAFLAACPVGHGLYIGRDLRASSPEVAAAVAQAARAEGVAVTDCGAVPTPALALASMAAGSAAIMVTGSHIPSDRNGLKFYLPGGEITKTDEAAILVALGRAPAGLSAPLSQADAATPWVQRYIRAFGPEALSGLRIGLWEHSAVSRDLIAGALEGLGAEVLRLGRSEVFIPVDTEAVPAEIRARIAAWCRDHGLDALVSTDGDGDRPLLADERGGLVPGDLLGQITARALGAEVVVTPVSSNSGVERSGAFGRVIRTKIGSPFVIAGMEAAGGRVAGYEANGGFLAGFEAQMAAGPLAPLRTRDSLLPLVAPLALARASGRSLSALIAAEPARFTAADRLEEIAPETSRALMARLEDGRFTALLSPLGESLSAEDRTDGLRLHLASGRVIHLRPSGNAPELRLYTEAESPEQAGDLLARGLEVLKAHLA
ncbi:phosphomannomutase [Falsigemmobacter intermedius]|uniref:Phosphomannomutase n=1 Tax=Falsigemmobacter intermedius TaxID=1553448 RepID=A0A451GG73_9RHOB|nr:phosphomannomutase [Falsigemmobacter intermedius]RWY34540.1 phosphomannomutase [Falsigemmobacter intermedius]